MAKTKKRAEGPKRDSSNSMSTVRARQQFSDLVNRVAYGKGRIVLTRRSRPLAAVVPIEDMELLEKLEDAEDRRAIAAARKEVARKGSVAWEDVRRELGLGRASR